jgi:hypothetical protein
MAVLYPQAPPCLMSLLKVIHRRTRRAWAIGKRSEVHNLTNHQLSLIARGSRQRAWSLRAQKTIDVTQATRATVTRSAFSAPVASESPDSPANFRRATTWATEVERVGMNDGPRRPQQPIASRQAVQSCDSAARTAGGHEGFSCPLPPGGHVGCGRKTGFSRLPGRAAEWCTRASPGRAIEGFYEAIRKNGTAMDGETVDEREIAALEADVKQLAGEIAEFAKLMQQAARELNSLARRCGLPSSASE